MKRKVHKLYSSKIEQLDVFINNFDTFGKAYGNQNRNSLRLFTLNDEVLNTKSFKVPNIVNKIVYRFFRKSKAERSFTYAKKLLALGIGTPQPVAYYEFSSALFFGKSYYISKHLDYNYTYRELTTNFNLPNYEAVLRAFTRFTYKLHQNNINFLDHSPGNTLIVTENDTPEFYLVDLNRMNFEVMSLEERIKNFAKLTTHKSMVEIMSHEYAKCCNVPYNKVFQLMWQYTTEFQKAYWRKQNLKRKLKFWKRNKA